MFISVLFSIFCALLVGICLLATLIEILSTFYKPNNAEKALEKGGHISMDEDANEKTPLVSDMSETTTKVINEKGRASRQGSLRMISFHHRSQIYYLN